jgi:hypothetical protein
MSTIAGITKHPLRNGWVQMARNAVDAIDGALLPVRYALHDRDSNFCASFRAMYFSGVQSHGSGGPGSSNSPTRDAVEKLFSMEIRFSRRVRNAYPAVFDRS